MSDDEALRAEAVARLKRKRKFSDDLAAYVVVNGVIWLIWSLTGHSTDGVPWPVWVTAIWGFFLVLDGLKAFGPGLSRGPITEAEVQREMRRLRHG